MSSMTLEKKMPTRIVLPLKDQNSADSGKPQLGQNVKEGICTVFTTRNLQNDVKSAEKKPTVAIQQYVVHKF